MVSDARRQSDWLAAKEATQEAEKDVKDLRAQLTEAEGRLAAAKQHEAKQAQNLFSE
jgi:hypothetical protein